jgi:hypothetical protein
MRPRTRPPAGPGEKSDTRRVRHLSDAGRRRRGISQKCQPRFVFVLRSRKGDAERYRLPTYLEYRYFHLLRCSQRKKKTRPSDSNQIAINSAVMGRTRMWRILAIFTVRDHFRAARSVSVASSLQTRYEHLMNGFITLIGFPNIACEATRGMVMCISWSRGQPRWICSATRMRTHVYPQPRLASHGSNDWKRLE